MKPQLSVFNFQISNQSADSVDINIDGYIVDSPTLEMYRQYWGDETSVSYKSFRDQLPADVKTINLIVNSGGGHVGDAMAICDLLLSLEAKGVTVNREGRGIVASAATYLVMGKNSRLSENCLFMIHDVSGYAYGNLAEMKSQVNALEKFNNMIIDFYCRETGLSSTVVSNMMKAETWLTADEAKAKGFIKNVGAKANITNRINPEQWQFNNTAILNTYNSFFQNSNTSEMDMKKVTDAIENGFNALLEKLGIKDKATDQNVQDAFKGFSESITNALKGETVTDEVLNSKVTNAVAEALKSIPESFMNAITDATKGFAKSDDIANLATKKDITDSIETLKKALASNAGGKNAGGDTEVKDENTAGSSKKIANNRFKGAKYDS